MALTGCRGEVSMYRVNLQQRRQVVTLPAKRITVRPDKGARIGA
jgi:hypothetical protein